MYLRRRDEEALRVASELGRRAMRDGFGVLDMVAVHRSALALVLLPVKPAESATIAAAEEFFRELLSPFETMFRGYVEAKAGLLRVNAAETE